MYFNNVQCQTFNCSCVISQNSLTWWRSCWNIQCSATLALRDGWRVASYFFGRGCPTQPSLLAHHSSLRLCGLFDSLFYCGAPHAGDPHTESQIQIGSTTCTFISYQRFFWLLELVASTLERQIDVSNLHSPLSLVSEKRSEWDQELQLSFFLHSGHLSWTERFMFCINRFSRGFFAFSFQGFVVIFSFSSSGVSAT